jgi:hypothetical protein
MDQELMVVDTNDEEIVKLPGEDLALSGPKDKGDVIYWVFLLYGFGALLPWNSILNCFDFFVLEVRYRLIKLIRCLATIPMQYSRSQ